MIPKFRCFVGNKRMFEVEVVDFVEKEVQVPIYDKETGEYLASTSFNFDDIILMQSTGLFDRNGVEIFEGDVVTFEDCDDVDTDFVYVNRGVIEYTAPTFHITNRNSTEMEDLLDGNTLDVIVLGSIYEHPELVEME